MTEERNQLAELFAACWKDDALKQRFIVASPCICRVAARVRALREQFYLSSSSVGHPS